MYEQHKIETYKSLITIALEGFKSLAIANGGAAVALLAYLGNIAGRNGSPQDMRCPMAFFLGGLFLCGVSMVFAYLTQLKLFNENNEKDQIFKFRHSCLLLLSITFFALSLCSFFAGSWLAVTRFK